MGGRLERLNFENPAAKRAFNQRAAHRVIEIREKSGDRFGKPRNKGEKAEFRKARMDAIGHVEGDQLKRAVAKISTGTATLEDRAFVLRHSGIVPTNGLNGDSEVFNISDLAPPKPIFEE